MREQGGVWRQRKGESAHDPLGLLHTLRRGKRSHPPPPQPWEGHSRCLFILWVSVSQRGSMHVHVQVFPGPLFTPITRLVYELTNVIPFEGSTPALSPLSESGLTSWPP